MYISKLKLSKKKITALVLSVFFAICLFNFGSIIMVNAQTADDTNFGLTYTEDVGVGNVDIRVTVARIVRIVLGVLGVVSLLVTLYGGYIYLTSEGNEQEISSAKKIIINGGIGFVIVLSSFAVTQFIISKLTEETNFTPVSISTGAPTGCADPTYAAAHPECSAPNSLPTISDAGRSPYNLQAIDTDYSFSWGAWNDLDGNPVEYNVSWYTGSKLCAGASVTSGWISATTWDPANSTRVCNDGANSWQVRGRDVVGTTGFNSCYIIDKVLCPSCSDGALNGTETAIDCGGSCNACPTCTDSIKNGTELGVDCGGSCSTACVVMGFTATTASGDESASAVNVNVSIPTASTNNITINYTLSGIATGAGSDYTLANGTATIIAGNTSVNIPLTIVDDTRNETNETVILTLSNPVGAVLGTNTVYTYTINDNDAPPTVAFAVTTASGSESVTGVNVVVSLSTVSGKNVTVNYALSGTATGSGADYTRANGVATITAGNPSVNIPITINNDTLIESNETIILTLSTPTNATLGTNTVHTYTITDDDVPPTVAFTTVATAGSEATTAVNIRVSIPAVTNNSVTVDYALSGTATGSGTDYTRANGTATVLAGNTWVNIPVTIVNDTLAELNETIILTLSNPTFASLGTNTVHTYTITDNDAPTIMFSPNSSTGPETSAAVSIPVSISSAIANTVTVNYSLSGTAVGSGTDYTLVNGIATIPAGSTATNIPLSIVNDTLFEGNETVVLTLSGPVNAILGTNAVYTYTITDNDTPPTIAFTATSASGLESVTAVNVNVSLSTISGSNTTVNYSVSGTATGGGTDYTRTNGTATINAGNTSVNIPVTVTNDTLVELSETIILTLSGPPTGATLGTNTVHTYTITDNDVPPTVAFTTVATSGSEATTAVNVRVSLSNSTNNIVTVNYALSGTAIGSGTDYTLINGTATVLAGNTWVNIPLVIVNDTLAELNETIILTLSNPNFASLGTNTVHTYTINDNDVPSVAFSVTSSSGPEANTAVNVVVALSAATTANVTVNYVVSGTATGGGNDYTRANGTATVIAGSTTTNIPITVISNTATELNETIILTLSGPTNATLGTNTVHTYTITDDDPPTVAFSVASASGLENTTAVNVVVSVSAVSSNSVTVAYALSGTATGGGTDYTRAAGTATINAGSTTFNIPITIADDTIIELNETIILTLSAPGNATLGTNTVYTYTITDNDASIVDTSSVDFGAGTMSSTAISGTGSTANVTLNPTMVLTSTIITTAGAGNWTVPAGVTSVKVEAWGGGGAGGGGNPVQWCLGAGGGGGAYAKVNALSVTPGNSIPYVVGSGGTGSYRSSGSAGGATSFNSTSVKAAGGDGGSGCVTTAGGRIANSIGDVIYNGGDGYRGYGNPVMFSGGGGSSGGSDSNGNTATDQTGGNSVINGGPGGNGCTIVQGCTGLTPTSGYGGGGGAGYEGGGSGYRGQLKLTYLVPVYSLPLPLPTVTTLTTAGAGTWTVPAGVTSVKVEAWGGGGGGGAGGWPYGGGGGAYARVNTLSVTPGSSIPYSVGVGGYGTYGSGGNTTFNTNIVVAAGGNCANCSSGLGGQSSASIGDIKYSGGNGAPPSPSGAGSGGGSGGSNSNGNNGNLNIGATSVTDGGPGGNGGNGAVGSSPISGPGGGGGAGSSGFGGSAGYTGQIRLTYTGYASSHSGTFTSRIIDTAGNTTFGIASWATIIPANTSLSMKIRTSTSATMTGATAFSSCTVVTNGADISSNSCVTDGHRYIQYQTTLSTTNIMATPELQSMIVNYTK